MMAVVAFMHVGMQTNRLARLPWDSPVDLARWSQVRWQLPADRIYRVQPDFGPGRQPYNLLLAPRHVDQESDSPWVLLDGETGGRPAQNADVVQDLGDGFFLLREQKP